MYSVCAILSSRATRDHHQLFHKVNTMLYGATCGDSTYFGMTKFGVCSDVENINDKVCG